MYMRIGSLVPLSILLLGWGLPCHAQQDSTRGRRRAEGQPIMGAEEAASRAARRGKGGPNEPAGLKPLTLREFGGRVEEGWDDRGGRGFEIVEDPSAPGSPPHIGRAIYPSGFLSGRGPIMTSFVIPGKPRTLYMAFWMRLSDNWVGHRTGVNKVFHIWIAGRNRVYLSAQGKGDGPYAPQVNLQGIPGPQIARNLRPSRGSGVGIRRGQWVRWELLMRANDPGQRDARVEWWINGQLAGSESGFALVGREGDPVWERVSWNPTWGGAGPPLRAQMSMDMDQVYVSVGP